MSHNTLFQPRSLSRHLVESAIIGVGLTALSYFVAIGAGWMTLTSLNWLEVLAVLTSYACTYLCVKQRRINYPIGAVSTAMYAILFLQNGLLASAVLNAYLTPALIYGWIRWRRDSDARPVTHVSLRWVPVYLAVAGIGYGGAALLSGALGGAMAWTDSLILAGTILAQFLLDNKKLENWVIWALVNVFAIYTYATAGLPLVAFQYVFFLGNTVYGFIAWKRSMQHDTLIRSDDGDAANQRTLAADPVRS